MYGNAQNNSKHPFHLSQSSKFIHKSSEFCQHDQFRHIIVQTDVLLGKRVWREGRGRGEEKDKVNELGLISSYDLFFWWEKVQWPALLPWLMKNTEWSVFLKHNSFDQQSRLLYNPSCLPHNLGSTHSYSDDREQSQCLRHRVAKFINDFSR